MEYHLTKRQLPQPEYVLDSVTEQPVDVDLTLPDYCPDIERILCCNLIPKIRMHNLSGDRLNVEGDSVTRVIYTDSDGVPRAYEYATPFSASLPLRDGLTDCAVTVDAKPEYLNCRALSPRKLSLHGAFSLYAKVVCAGDLSYCGYEGEDDDLQVKRETVSAAALRGLCSESFSVQEDISADAAGTLLSYRVSARITELKAIHNKIMLSAELKAEILTLGAENRELKCMSYSIPVSRVVDCEGVDEDSVIDGSLTVLGSDLRLSDDALDGSATLNLDAKLQFTAYCYHEETLELMTDAFSTLRDVRLRTSPTSCCAGIESRVLTDIGKAAVSVEDGIGKVIDVHAERLNAAANVSAGSIILSSKLIAVILYENSEGELRCVERDASFMTRPEMNGCDAVERLNASVDSLSYRLTDDHTLELRAELTYRLTCCRRMSCTAVSGVTADEDAPERENDSAVILYYADEGDTVWNISKRFCSRPQEVAAENGIEGETVPAGTLLLIPTA